MLPNVGAPELLVIFVVALVVVGPKRLPEIGRAIGRGLNELRKIQDEVRDMVKFDLNEEPSASTPRMSGPAALEAVAAPVDDEEDEDEDEDVALDPEPVPGEITHSQRVVELAEAEPKDDMPPPPAPAAAPNAASESEPSPWTYDLMDDDEPDAAPPYGSAE